MPKPCLKFKSVVHMCCSGVLACTTLYGHIHIGQTVLDFRAINLPINGLFIRIQMLIPRSIDGINPAAALYKLTLKAYYVPGAVLGALNAIVNSHNSMR